jgi:hypothetical protein
VEKRKRGREKKRYLVEKEGRGRQGRDKAEGEERELELPKDLSAKSENCRDLFVK